MRFSIIVPVYKHWDIIGKLIEAVEAQTVDVTEFELLLVDNGSPGFVSPRDLPSNCRTLSCQLPGSYAARNMGAAAARGDWLVFTDADCRPCPEWLDRLDGGRRNISEAQIVVGRVRMVSHRAHPGWVETYDLVCGIPQHRYAKKGYGATANLMVSRSAFEQVGGFETSRYSGADVEFCQRARQSGIALCYNHAAVVDHPARTSWRELVTKARRIKGAQAMAKKRSQRALWFGVTLVRPLRGGIHIVMQPRATPWQKCKALAVLTALWPIEVVEFLKVSFGYRAERR